MEMPKEICCGNCLYYRGAKCHDGQGVCARKAPVPYAVAVPEGTGDADDGLVYTQTQPVVSAQGAFCGDFEYFDGDSIYTVFHLLSSDSDSFQKLKSQLENE